MVSYDFEMEICSINHKRPIKIPFLFFFCLQACAIRVKTLLFVLMSFGSVAVGGSAVVSGSSSWGPKQLYICDGAFKTSHVQ